MVGGWVRQSPPRLRVHPPGVSPKALWVHRRRWGFGHFCPFFWCQAPEEKYFVFFEPTIDTLKDPLPVEYGVLPAWEVAPPPRGYPPSPILNKSLRQDTMRSSITPRMPGRAEGAKGGRYIISHYCQPTGFRYIFHYNILCNANLSTFTCQFVIKMNI